MKAHPPLPTAKLQSNSKHIFSNSFISSGYLKKTEACNIVSNVPDYIFVLCGMFLFMELSL